MDAVYSSFSLPLTLCDTQMPAVHRQSHQRRSLATSSSPPTYSLRLFLTHCCLTFNGSADEKIRRAVEAIRAFNDGKGLDEMYRLSEANVRYVSGSRHGTVKAYFVAHPELNDYNDGYSFSLQHDRGKTPITEVVKW